jgi:hypothetical protein
VCPTTRHKRAAREAIVKAGRRPTEVIDRFWFRSVYFLEPGGVLFELATDGPGFTIDESAANLGEQLILPRGSSRSAAMIEAALPPLRDAHHHLLLQSDGGARRLPRGQRLLAEEKRRRARQPEHVQPAHRPGRVLGLARELADGAVSPIPA